MNTNIKEIATIVIILVVAAKVLLMEHNSNNRLIRHIQMMYKQIKNLNKINKDLVTMVEDLQKEIDIINLKKQTQK